MILQRLINSAVIQHDEHTVDGSEPLAGLSRKQRIALVHLDLRDVRTGSAIFHAIWQILQNPAVQAQLGIAVATVNATICHLVTTALFDKVNRLRRRDNPFKPNDATRKQLEDLAAVAARGEIVFTIRLGQEICVIDAQVRQRLEDLKRKIKGVAAPFSGMVVGSSMRRRFVEVSIAQFNNAEIPCLYRKSQERLIRELTQIQTAVVVYGKPVWEGTDQPVGAPNSIEVERLERTDAVAVGAGGSFAQAPLIDE